MTAIFPIPRANAPLIVQGGLPTREWYSYWQNLQADSGGPSNADLANDITIISDKLGSPDGTPENIPPQTSGGSVQGINSVVSLGAFPGIVQISLRGDVDAPGNTYYYGTGPAGDKGYFTVASAFLGATSNITLTTAVNGVTTIDLADVPNQGIGSLFAITRDAKGRIIGYRAATITGTANRITVANGDASAGLPTIDIASTYIGQTSITTLGTITTGTWNGTAVDAPHGGTGQTTYAVGDILYASATNALSRLPAGANGQVLTLASGVPSWASASGSSPLTTKGDLYGFSTANARVAVGTDGQVLTADSTTALGVAWKAPGGSSSVIDILLIDSKTSGTGGGSATAATWNARNLNTIVYDDTGVVTITSNQFTLPAGVYRLSASAPAVAAWNHKLRLFNVTDSSVVSGLYGSSEWNQDPSTAQTRAFLEGQFTLAASKTMRLDHYTTHAGNTTQTLGIATNVAGVNETYAIIKLRKIA